MEQTRRRAALHKVLMLNSYVMVRGMSRLVSSFQCVPVYESVLLVRSADGPRGADERAGRRGQYAAARRGGVRPRAPARAAARRARARQPGAAQPPPHGTHPPRRRAQPRQLPQGVLALPHLASQSHARQDLLAIQNPPSTTRWASGALTSVRRLTFLRSRDKT